MGGDRGPDGRPGPGPGVLDPVGAPVVVRSPAWTAGPVAGEPLRGPTGQVLAGRRRRVVAYLLDLLVLFGLGIAVSVLFDALLGPPSSPPDRAISLAYLAVVGVVGAAYWVGLWTGGRATLGMRLLGIRVVDAGSGGPVAAGVAGRRWAVLEGVVIALGVLTDVAFWVDQPELGTAAYLGTALWALVLLATTCLSPTRQGLHDRFAGTLVVR
jgi:uncharacterized RDD family membrane protein YckC